MQQKNRSEVRLSTILSWCSFVGSGSTDFSTDYVEASLRRMDSTTRLLFYSSKLQRTTSYSIRLRHNRAHLQPRVALSHRCYAQESPSILKLVGVLYAADAYCYKNLAVRRQ